MDVNTTWLISLFIISFSAVAIVLGDQIKGYSLKKEQIKADAMVKAEEIKARNRLELEKLMIQGSQNDAVLKSKAAVFDDDERVVREKERL